MQTEVFREPAAIFDDSNRAGKTGAYMNGFRLQNDWLQRRFSVVVMTAAMALFASATVVVMPTIRSVQTNGNGPSEERSEEPSVSGRLDHARSLRIDYCRLATMRSCLMPQSLGHAQRPVLEPPSGHRLPNGLLAPLTC